MHNVSYSYQPFSESISLHLLEAAFQSVTEHCGTKFDMLSKGPELVELTCQLEQSLRKVKCLKNIPIKTNKTLNT